MDMRFGTLSKRSLYRAGSLVTVSKELSKYKLDLVGVLQVRWDSSGNKPAGECTFFYRKVNTRKTHELGTGYLYINDTYQ
jgi:hypothetical protein